MAPNFRRALCCSLCASALGLWESSVHAEPSHTWWLGGVAHISLDKAGEAGWLLGLGAGARRTWLSWLDLQLRVYGTYRAPPWRYEPGTGVVPLMGLRSDAADTRIVGEGTARWRPWRPLFLGLGPQAGVRIVPYYVLMNLRDHSVSAGTDVQPIARAVVELGADFGPNDIFEVAARLAAGSTLGRGAIESGFGTDDDEVSFTIGAWLPL